jgi:hypothetical protein
MRANQQTMPSLGDVIAAAYDRMLNLTRDRKKAGQLTASSIGRLLARTGNATLARRMFAERPRRGIV